MTDFLSSLFSLEGKTALITGGAKGIGNMMSEHLLKAGATVYISSRSVQDCEAAATTLSRYGTCVAMPYDLSFVKNIEALTSQIEAAGRGLDILINNSGRTWGAPLESYPEKGWDSVMALNIKTPFFLVQKLLPLLSAAGTIDDPARILNIGSVAGLMTETLSAYAYMSSKAAILHLTKGLARDLADKHIAVNAIAPGFFPSRMTRHITDNEKIQAQVLKTIPMGRMGRPDEIGALALYLCSKASAFMTGSVIPIDGGSLVGVNDASTFV